MSKTERPKKSAPPQIVKLDKALKLAEQWVNGMTKCVEDKPEEEAEGRPPKLGLGAKVPRHSSSILGMSDDPIARKLHAKLEAEKRKVAKSMEETKPSAKNGGDDDDEENNLESRTSAFGKKRAGSLNKNLPANKKRK